MRHNLSLKNQAGYFPQLTLQRFSLKDRTRKRFYNNRFEQVSLLTRGEMKRSSLMNDKSSVQNQAFKKAKHWHLQILIYKFLEKPSGWLAGFYQVMIFATVFLCLILSVLATIPQYDVIASNLLMQAEMVIVIWLSVELCLRVWSAGCRSRYQTWKGRLKFMRNPFCILDLTVIIASISLTIVATSQNKHKNFAAAAFRGLRFFQILRMLRVDRRAGTWRLLGTVVWAHRQELITTFYIGFLSLIVSSFVMYLLEKDAHGTKIFTFADSLWWGVITLCTIGYGDVYPVTWGGKLLASSCALIGISFFALPAGILGSGFALKVQAMQRQKHLNRRRAPAATLIQCLWRCYAADAKSLSKATWKVHIKAVAANHAHVINPNNIPEYSISQLAKPYVGTNSFLNRVTSLKRRTPPLTSSSNDSAQLKHNLSSDSKQSYIKTNSLVQLAPSSFNNKENVEFMSSSMASSRRDAIVMPELFNAQTSVYGGRSSQIPSPETTTPQNDSDSLTNINIDENNNSSNITNNNNNNLLIDQHSHHSQNRSTSSFIVALSKMQNEQPLQKVTPIKSSFAHRTLNFLSEFNTSNLLKSDGQENDASNLNLNDGSSGGGHHSHSHHNNPNVHNKPQLTMQQKNAIRAIRKIRYFVARRKFREALRPYDVTDVIEQYSAGNLDMLARIKTLQFRLDKVLGSAKSKDCYDSSNISLASRIVKVERQVDDIDLKLDKLINLYTIDMKILIEKVSHNHLELSYNKNNNKAKFKKSILHKSSTDNANVFDNYFISKNNRANSLIDTKQIKCVSYSFNKQNNLSDVLLNYENSNKSKQLEEEVEEDDNQSYTNYDEHLDDEEDEYYEFEYDEDLINNNSNFNENQLIKFRIPNISILKQEQERQSGELVAKKSDEDSSPSIKAKKNTRSLRKKQYKKTNNNSKVNYMRKYLIDNLKRLSNNEIKRLKKDEKYKSDSQLFSNQNSNLNVFLTKTSNLLAVQANDENIIQNKSDKNVNNNNNNNNNSLLVGNVIELISKSELVNLNKLDGNNGVGDRNSSRLNPIANITRTSSQQETNPSKPTNLDDEKNKSYSIQLIEDE